MVDPESVQSPAEEPSDERTAPVTPRPLWMDVFFAVAIALGFGLSLVRTPSTWLWAVALFLIGCLTYGVLRVRWARRNPRPGPVQQRTSDGVLYLGLFLVAFLLSGVRAPQQWQIPYAVGAGLLIGGAGLIFLRREETRRVRQSSVRRAGPPG